MLRYISKHVITNRQIGQTISMLLTNANKKYLMNTYWENH